MTKPVIQEEPVRHQLQLLRRDIEQELNSILSWWLQHTTDEQYGGFYGSIDHNNTVDILAPKGSVLNSRILWTFSAAYNSTHEPQWLKMAARAYEYISRHFLDQARGGVYWTVDHSGDPFDTKKQVCAQAFALYALTEYFRATGDKEVKEKAIELFTLIEHYGYDKSWEGYQEIFNCEWEELDGQDRSDEEADEKKTMNTHLHVLEAYTNLYRIWPDDYLRRQIARLINNFLDHMVNPVNHHLFLCFDERWGPKSTVISFGHDIQASWLVAEAADIVSDHELIIRAKKKCLQMAYAAAQGLDDDGGLWFEQDGTTRQWVKEKHWWPQAEALVGFFHAWQVSGDNTFFMHTLRNWEFIRQNLIDKEYGEWYWGVLNESTDAGKTIMSWEDKAGLSKCPYHNSRACMELMRRIDGIVR